MDARQIEADLAKVRKLGGSGYSVLAGSEVTHLVPHWVRGEVVSGHPFGADPRRSIEGIALPSRHLAEDFPGGFGSLAATDSQAEVASGQPPSVGEEIAARVLREQKDEALALLADCGLGAELPELIAIEERLRLRSERDRRHAAFSARNLLEAIADRLFPAREEPWRDRQGTERDVGQGRVANRLAAYVDQRLGGRLEPSERRAFQGMLDATARWVGSGPHGVHTAADAELAYTRLIGVLAVLARAHRAA